MTDHDFDKEFTRDVLVLLYCGTALTAGTFGTAIVGDEVYAGGEVNRLWLLLWMILLVSSLWLTWVHRKVLLADPFSPYINKTGEFDRLQ